MEVCARIASLVVSKTDEVDSLFSQLLGPVHFFSRLAVFGKVGAFFTSIPQPVLGGMSTFLFANIAISGIKVMTSHALNRRERFILAIAGSFGIGTITVPQWFNNNFFLDCPSIESDAGRGVCNAAKLTLSTGYAVGCLVALLLNAVLPAEPNDEEVPIVDEDETRVAKSAHKEGSSHNSEIEDA